MTATGWTSEVPDTSGMTDPVRCTHCGRAYDLCKVTITGRYTDRRTWTSPCCRVPVDDSADGVEFTRSMKHYVRLDRS